MNFETSCPFNRIYKKHQSLEHLGFHEISDNNEWYHGNNPLKSLFEDSHTKGKVITILGTSGVGKTFWTRFYFSNSCSFIDSNKKGERKKNCHVPISFVCNLGNEKVSEVNKKDKCESIVSFYNLINSFMIHFEKSKILPNYQKVKIICHILFKLLLISHVQFVIKKVNEGCDIGDLFQRQLLESKQLEKDFLKLLKDNEMCENEILKQYENSEDYFEGLLNGKELLLSNCLKELSERICSKYKKKPDDILFFLIVDEAQAFRYIVKQKGYPSNFTKRNGGAFPLISQYVLDCTLVEEDNMRRFDKSSFIGTSLGIAEVVTLMSSAGKITKKKKDPKDHIETIVISPDSFDTLQFVKAFLPSNCVDHFKKDYQIFKNKDENKYLSLLFKEEYCYFPPNLRSRVVVSSILTYFTEQKEKRGECNIIDVIIKIIGKVVSDLFEQFVKNYESFDEKIKKSLLKFVYLSLKNIGRNVETEVSEIFDIGISSLVDCCVNIPKKNVISKHTCNEIIAFGYLMLIYVKYYKSSMEIVNKALKLPLKSKLFCVWDIKILFTKMTEAKLIYNLTITNEEKKKTKKLFDNDILTNFLEVISKFLIEIENIRGCIYHENEKKELTLFPKFENDITSIACFFIKHSQFINMNVKNGHISQIILRDSIFDDTTKEIRNRCFHVS